MEAGFHLSSQIGVRLLYRGKGIRCGCEGIGDHASSEKTLIDKRKSPQQNVVEHYCCGLDWRRWGTVSHVHNTGPTTTLFLITSNRILVNFRRFKVVQYLGVMQRLDLHKFLGALGFHLFPSGGIYSEVHAAVVQNHSYMFFILDSGYFIIPFTHSIIIS